MKKSLNLMLEDEDIIELMSVLMDSDSDDALAFLRKHFKDKPGERGFLAAETDVCLRKLPMIIREFFAP